MSFPIPQRVNISDATDPMPPTPTMSTLFSLIYWVKYKSYSIIFDDSHFFQSHQSTVGIIIFDDFAHAVFQVGFRHKSSNLIINLFLFFDKFVYFLSCVFFHFLFIQRGLLFYNLLIYLDEANTNKFLNQLSENNNFYQMQKVFKQKIKFQNYIYSLLNKIKYMQTDSYSHRLKEIREKYGAAVKDNVSCLRSHDRQLSRYDGNQDDKYGLNRKTIDNALDRKLTQNIDPLSTGYSNKYSAQLDRQKQNPQHYDSFLYTQSKDDRLKQIEKIRQSFAESRKQAMEDWARAAEKSKSKYVQAEKFNGLRDRTNTGIVKNSFEYKKSIINETPVKQSYRSRGQSHISAKLQPEVQTYELRRNYDDIQSKSSNRKQSQMTTLGSYRSDSVSRFDRQSKTPVKMESNFTSEFKNTRNIQNETASPIRGLMKLDSLQKTRRNDPVPIQSNLSKFIGTPSYDISNIDKIQDRIQKILAKK